MPTSLPFRSTATTALAVALIFSLVAVFTPAARAQFTWTNTSSASTTWDTTANWAGNSVPTSGATVTLTADLTADQSITLGANRTVGALTVGDTGGTLFGYTITGNSLIFDAPSAPATYTHSANAGTVTLASAINLTDNLNATIGAGSTSLFSGAISGAGTLTKLGTGTLTLTGANTYSGGTAVSAGTLQVGDGGSLGSGDVSLSNDTTLVFNHSDDLTVTNSITANLGDGLTLVPVFGRILKLGTGTLTLTGPVEPEVTVSAGSLQISSRLGLRDSYLTIENNSAVIFESNGVLNFRGYLNGSGSVTKIGGGDLVIYSSLGYSGSTTISAGTLVLADGARLGPGDLINNAALMVNTDNYIWVENRISGSGTLTKLSSGTLVLTGANSYEGSTLLLRGTLQVGDSSSSGSLGSGDVINHAHLAFNRSNNLTVANLVSGSGSLSQLGSGTLTLTGNNSYEGGTTLSTGTLKIGDGGTTGSLGSGDITNNATLIFYRSDAVTVANTISGSGSLTQLGTGYLSLTGNNAYSGTTTVSAGTLQIGDGGTTGSLGSGNVSNHAVLAFNRSNNLTVANTISGPGSLTQLGTGYLSLTGNNSYSGTTTVSAGTLQIGDGGTTGSLGSGDIINHAALAFNRSNNLTVTNAISGIGSLTQRGTGTLTLTGNNAYAGITAVSSGTLRVGNGGTSGSLGSGTVTNDATLDFNRSDDLTVANTITGTGVLTQSGGGSLTLTAANTYSGGTTLSSGTLRIGDGGTTGSLGPGNVTNNATLAFNRSDAVTVANPISGSGSIIQLGAGTLTLAGTNTYSAGTTLSSGTLALGSAGALGTIGNLTFNGGTLQFSVANTTDYSARFSSSANQAYRLDTNGQIVTLSSALTSLGGSLVKLGSGTLTLTGTNTYSGGTTLSAGTLQLGSSGALGTSGALTFNGGTLRYSASNTTDYSARFSSAANQDYRLDTNGQSVTLASALASPGGSLTKLGSGTAILAAANTYTGATTLSAGRLQIGNGGTTGSLGTGSVSISAGATLAFNRSNTATVTNDISGAGILTQLGSGTLLLSGNSSFTGGTTLSGGRLALGSAGALGSSGAITFNGGTLQFSAANTTDYSTRFNTSANQVYRLDTNGQSVTLASALTSSGGTLTKLGSGTLTLTGANTYSGGTAVSAGTLQVGDGGSLGSGDVSLSNDTTLVFNHSDDLTVTNSITANLGDGLTLVPVFGRILKLGTGTLTLTGPVEPEVTVSAGSLQISSRLGLRDSYLTIENNSAVIFESNGVLNFRGYLNGSGSVTKIGGGDLVIYSSLGYSGSTTISAGTLVLADGARLGPGDLINNAALMVNTDNYIWVENRISGSGTLTKLSSGTLVLTGANSYEGSTLLLRGTLQVGDSSSSGSLGSGDVINHAHLAFNRSNNLTVANLVSGSGSLSQLGSGTLTLTGNNSYEGGTTLSTGTTRIANPTGSAFGTGAVTVAAGATLTGAGSFTGALQLNGTFSPGNSPGLATIGSGSVLGGLTLMEIAGTTRGVTYDAINVGGAGALTLGGTLQVTLLDGYSPVSGASFQLFHATTISGAFATLDLPALTAGLSWDTSQLASAGTLAVSASAIPEPSTYAAFAGLAALALAALRRRRA